MRKLATAAAVSLALASGGAFGLGLGDIEMRSSLNQPMQAEIRLTAVKPGELEGMVVNLASADAFARAGIERSEVLTDLSFRVDNSGLAPVIRITSNSPVVEPFLNFLLEVDWPQGRMIREYTVLLDPPVFMTPNATSRSTMSDQAAVVQRGEEALIVPTPIQRGLDDGFSANGEVVELDLLQPPTDELIDLQALSNGRGFDDSGFEVETFGALDGEVVSLSDLSAPNTSAFEQRNDFVSGNIETIGGFEVEVLGNTIEVSNDDNGFGGTPSSFASSGSAGGDSVSVRSGDTLYEIAKSNAVGGASVQQMMMALLKANDSSFVNSNVNRLKAGADLRIPGASEATQMSQAQAVAALSEQTQLWNDYRGELQGGSGSSLASTGGSSSSSGQDGSNAGASDNANTGGSSFSDRAQAILDNAREEIREREELKLVADSSESSSSAGASGNDTSESGSDRVGEVNRRLQLAREELASTRLQSRDLSEQASELTSTGDNLDSLVELRQTGVANLEAQLADARKNGQETVDGVGNFVEGGGESTVDLLTDASNSTDGFVDSGTNALTDAGEELGEVQMFSEDGEQQNANGDAQAEESGAWYQNLFSQPLKWLLGGLALLGLLGLGALLFWRRKKAHNDEMSYRDDVDYIDDDEAADLHAEMNQDHFDSADDFDDFGEVGTGTVANNDFDDYDSLDARQDIDGRHNDFDMDDELDDQDFDTSSRGRDFGGNVAAAAAGAGIGAGVGLAGAAGLASVSANEGADTDDTISEVDVYLNYGLHGQAEELLNKAVENEPNNPEFARKLLETYHGQGSAEKYLPAAKNFHARFGGESNPDWNSIASDGAELLPDEPLFAGAVSGDDTQNLDFGNETASFDSDPFATDKSGFDNDPFLSNESSVDNDEKNGDGFSLKTPALAATAAVTGGFAAMKAKAAGAVDFGGKDETELMDQSLDPAFAFDETDLEATGDFSQIADELSAETGDSVDFPSFDDTLAVPSGSGDSFLDSTIADSNSGLRDSLSKGKMASTGVIGTADDLTLDLDQLSGDLELDSAELMNPDLSDIDLPELSRNSNLDGGNLEARVAHNDSDAMETMLDLAKAYIDMGDKDSASSALDEIVKSGNPAQVSEAETLLRKIS